MALCGGAHAQAAPHRFEIAAGDLKAALEAYAAQSGAQLIYKAEDVKGRTTKGVHSEMAPADALHLLLEGTSLSVRTDSSGAMVLFVEPVGKDERHADDIQSVTISANKRPQNSHDIAGNITSFSGTMLEEDGMKSAEDVLQRAPGIQINKGDPDLSMPTIRGVATATNANTIGLQQSTTGIYIEDVPFTDPIAVNSTADLAPFDLEGIDVLRGPQGALYGSSSLGGAIRYSLMKPDLKAFGATVLADVGAPTTGGVNHSEYGMLNVPLKTDVAGLRAVAYDRREAGYIDNLGTDKRLSNELHQTGGRLIGTLKPAPTLKVSATYLYQDTKIADAFAISPSATSLTNDSPTPSSRDDSFSLGQLLVEKQFGGLTLTSSTSEVTKRVHSQSDVTRQWADIGNFDDLPLLPEVDGPARTRTHAFSEELRIAGAVDKVNFVAGLFYQRYRASYDSQYNAPGGAALFGDDLVPGDVLYTEDDVNQTQERALFADAEYDITDKLSVDIGGRFYRNSQTATYNSHLLDALFGVLPPQGVSNAQNGFTPKLNVKYRFAQALWYATMSEGYRFGGVNPGTDLTYRSDKLWNYETGFQYFPSHDLNLDIDYFHVDWRDAQLNALVGSGATAVNGILNVGKAAIDGLEAKLVWNPVAALSVQGSLAYINAVTAADFTNSAGTLVPSGARLPGTAKFQSTEEIDYKFTGLGDSNGRIALTHNFVGSRRSNLDRPGWLGSYQVFGARASLAWSNYELAAYIDNIGNSRGSSGGSRVRTLGGDYYNVYYPIKPRVVGLSLRYDY